MAPPPRNPVVAVAADTFADLSVDPSRAPSDDGSARLVERAKTGDMLAFERLVRAHQGIAFRLAYSILHDRAEAEDAVQEAFVRAYSRLGRFRAGAPFRPWMLTIVANQSKDRLRAAASRRRLASAALGSWREPVDDQPEVHALASSRDSELRSALSRLPERDRVAIYLRYFAGLNEAEMAAALGCRPGTVKSRLSRALGCLRALIGDEGR